MSKCLSIFFVIFIFYSVAEAYEIKKISPIPFGDTPLKEFIDDVEGQYLRAFPDIYLSYGDELEPENTKKLYSLIVGKDLGVCLDAQGAIKDFCKLYITLFLLGTESNDLKLFFSLPSPISDFAYLGSALSLLRNQEYEEAEKMADLVHDKAVIIYFSSFFSLFKDEKDSEYVNFAQPTMAKIQLLFQKNPDIVKPFENANHLPAFIYFLLGERAFYGNDYIKAGDYFMKASDEGKIRKVALENAFYAYINGNDLNRAKSVVKKLGNDVNKVILGVLAIIDNKKPFISDELFVDEIFGGFLKEKVKGELREGKDFSYLSKINSVGGDEELLFLTALSKFVYQRPADFKAYIHRINWKNSHYKEFLMVLQKREIPEGTFQKELIEDYNLYNYYPFNFFYANIIKNKNRLFAEQLYENVIRHGKKATKKVLLKSYMGLASIYKSRKRYNTAIKVLEEALELELDEEEIMMEIIRLIGLKEDYEELRWRAEKLYHETKNKEHKKELQIFIDLCYEKLGILKERNER